MSKINEMLYTYVRDADLCDETRIGNTVWRTLKELAMKPNYKESSWWVSECTV